MKAYKRDLKQMEARRHKGMQLLAQGMTQAEVARVLGVSRQTASTWAAALTRDEAAWRRKPLGRPAGLGPSDKKALCRLLSKGALVNGFPTELWSLPRVAALILREFGLQYSTVHVWRLLGEIHFSCQPQTAQEVERDKQATGDCSARRWLTARKKSADRVAQPSP